MKINLAYAMRCKWLLVFWIGIFLAHSASATDPFIRVSLKNGVSFQMPRNWTVLTDSSRTTLDAFVDAKGLRTPGSELNFAANFFDTQQNTLALLNLRYYPDQTMTQAQIQSLSAPDLAEISEYMRSELVKAGTLTGFSILNWYGVTKTPINGLQSLVVQYRRSAMTQARDRLPHRVKLIRVIDASRSFTLTVSYREDQAPLLAPICDAISNSLRIGATSLLP